MNLQEQLDQERRTVAQAIYGADKGQMDEYGNECSLTRQRYERMAAAAIKASALPQRNAQVQAVLELHTRDEIEVMAGACAEEECDHEDKCPTLPFAICAECHRVAEEADPHFGERGVHVVAYPCPTIRAIEEATP